MLYSETELKKRLKSGCPVFYFYASDEALVRSAAAKGLINATDCADYLTKKGIPFRDD